MGGKIENGRVMGILWDILV